jgi:hypothetical protein
VTVRLPAQLQTELRSLRAELPRVTAHRLIRHARAAALLITWCRRALARGHVVPTAVALRDALGLGRAELGTLRIPTDVLDLFPRWRDGSCEGFRPPAGKASLVAAAAMQPLGPIRVLLAPAAGALPLMLPLLRGLATRLDLDTQITVMVDPGKAAREFRRAAETVMGKNRRVRFETGRSATMFARDHALAARDPAGAPLLIIPRGFRPERGKEDVAMDERSARRALGVRVRRSMLYWEGGNILFDGHCCLVGADLIRENMARLGLSRDEVLAILEGEFGTRVAVLGELARAAFDGTQDRLSRSGQASYHIDLDVAPLGAVDGGEPVVMLSDPDLGLSVLPRVLRHARLDAWHGLTRRDARRLQAEEYRRVATQRRPRLERYRRQLERLGYRVVRIPELRVDPERSLAGVANLDFAFCNVLPALHRGRAAVYYLPWGIPALDDLAERQWRRAGVEPIALSRFAPLAHGMMGLAAGLHCFVGPVPAVKPRRTAV